MNKRSIATAFVLLATVFSLPYALASDTADSGALTVVVENDLFYNQDRNYTSGVAFLWAPTEQETPEIALRIADSVPGFPAEGRVRTGYVLGQNLYTPRDITIANPASDDRPYAGWLYGTINMGVETARQLDQVALTLGMVGPASQGESIQKFVHTYSDSPEPQGWDHQLNNELGVLATYQRSWRELVATDVAGLVLDVTPHVGGAVGNVYTYANTGLTVRYGNPPSLDYGPPRVQPSVPGSSFFIPANKFTWYVFAGVEARAVAHSIFLDGNTFSDNRHVDKEWLVGDLQWGMVLSWQRVRMSYTHVVRTQEFKTQDGNDQFGALSLSLSF